MTTHCPNCKSEAKIYIKGNKIPLVNNFKRDKKLYNTDFYYCRKCDLGFLKYFHPDQKLYNKFYLYKGELNKSKIKFVTFALKNVIKKKTSVLEIGGGDGYLGKILKKSVNYKNIDPSSLRGFKTTNIFFDDKKIQKKFDIIICLNVLAHIDNPINLIKKIKNVMHKNTKILFSVQNGLEQIKSGYLDNIYHEHKYYYSVYSFKNRISKILENLNYYKYPLHGESIVATNINLKLKKYKINKSSIKLNKIKEAEVKYKKTLKLIKNKIKKSSSVVYGVGCAPRSLKLLYDLGESSKKIKYIIEPKNSRKLNIKLPKKNIKVVYRDEVKIGSKYTVIWFPWHIKPPKIFQNLIWPYH